MLLFRHHLLLNKISKTLSNETVRDNIHAFSANTNETLISHFEMLLKYQMSLKLKHAAVLFSYYPFIV